MHVNVLHNKLKNEIRLSSGRNSVHHFIVQYSVYCDIIPVAMLVYLSCDEVVATTIVHHNTTFLMADPCLIFGSHYGT